MSDWTKNIDWTPSDRRKIAALKVAAFLFLDPVGWCVLVGLIYALRAVVGQQ